MGIVEMHKKINTSIAGKTLYLTVVALYVLKTFFDTTLFNIPWPVWYDNMLRVLLYSSIFLKFCNAQQDAQANIRKTILFCVITVLLFKSSWLSTEYAFLIDIALLAVGAVGIPYKKILKIGFWVGIYILLIAMLGSFAGCITDLVYSSNGHFRHSFGVVYPTDFAAHIVFLALIGWALYGGNSALFTVGVLALAGFTSYFCRAKCSTAVLCLLAIAVLYHSLMERLEKKQYAKTKVVDKLLPYIMPLCALLMITLTLLYAPENQLMAHIDILLTNRLRLGLAAIDTYKIKLFGTAFEQVGFGGGTAWTYTYTYNFIDSSYILVLVRYGLLILLAICVQYIEMANKAIENRHRRLALVLALMAVHSMIEHHLPEVAYNLFLILPFADFKWDKTMAKEKLIHLNKKSCALCIALLAGGIIAITAFPRTIGYLKTIVNMLRLDDPKNHICFIGIAAIFLAVIQLLLWLASKTIALSIKGEKVTKIAYAGICIFSLIILCISLLGEPLINQAREEYDYLIEEDRLVIEALLAKEKSIGRIYVDHLPEAYKREYSGLSGMIFAAEGLAYKKNATLITEDLEELTALIYSGYEYGEISPRHAVYTNSAVAKGVLEEAGIKLSNFYNKQKLVDLADMAIRNNLEFTEHQTLLLDGSWKSLIHGSGITIYKGKLRVEYQIHLTNSNINEGIAATAKITSDWGQCTWSQKDIYLSDFDEDGQFTLVLDAFLRFSCPNMEFQLLVQDGVELEIQEIRYGKIS